jgi:hypothetical protein
VLSPTWQPVPPVHPGKCAWPHGAAGGGAGRRRRRTLRPLGSGLSSPLAGLPQVLLTAAWQAWREQHSSQFFGLGPALVPVMPAEARGENPLLQSHEGGLNSRHREEHIRSSAFSSLRSQILGHSSRMLYGRYTTMMTMNEPVPPVRDFPERLPIYDNHDKELGTVSALGVQSNYLVMRTGRFFHHNVSIPVSAIARTDGQGVYLNRTRQEIHNLTLGGWSSLGNVDLNTGVRAGDDLDASPDPAPQVDSDGDTVSAAAEKSEPAAAVLSAQDEVRTN